MQASEVQVAFFHHRETELHGEREDERFPDPVVSVFFSASVSRRMLLHL